MRATSFGRIADDYDRVRPGPADEALDWLVPPGCAVAVDLAAGTGLFSRALRSRVTRVIAVEPDERMRAVLADRSPGVEVAAGSGEGIPVPDASADAVFISSAWHWLDPARAVPEIARVLRDERPARSDLDRPGPSDGLGRRARRLTRPPADQPSEADGPRPRRGYAVTLPAGAPFANVATASFTFTRSMTADDVVAWLATYSRIITAPEEQRAAGLARARAALGHRADANGMIDVPVRSSCWRADRIRR